MAVINVPSGQYISSLSQGFNTYSQYGYMGIDCNAPYTGYVHAVLVGVPDSIEIVRITIRLAAELGVNQNSAIYNYVFIGKPIENVSLYRYRIDTRDSDYGNPPGEILLVNTRTISYAGEQYLVYLQATGSTASADSLVNFADVVSTGIYAQEPLDSFSDVIDALNLGKNEFPITYRPTNSLFPNAPTEAAVGDTVIVPVEFPDGYGLANTGDIYVQCNGMVIPSTYENGQLTFTMPDPS